MSVYIPFLPEEEAELRHRASVFGKDLISFIREAIEEKLAEAPSEGELRARLSPQQRIAELEAWAASHPRLRYVVDDSRESIYDGRGE
ncbi:MAG TPA: hypothetical protein VGM03_00605 [Phycisphaerae bacterium]|jgi:hypothetical protein